MNYKHGHATGLKVSPTYVSWARMLQRCHDPKFPEYFRYGAVGIQVQEKWHVFKNFLNDMGERPEELSLDRINNEGNYYKENCRWATDAEQARNRSTTKLTIEKVAVIRSLWADGNSAGKIAGVFNVSRECVNGVVHYRNWRI